MLGTFLKGGQGSFDFKVGAELGDFVVGDDPPH